LAISDVTIYGAGIFGLCVAWSCVKRGAKVQIIDPNGLGTGASGGVVGALAPHVPERWDSKKAFQLESLMMSPKYWSEIEEISGMPSGYGRFGRLQPIGNANLLELAQIRHVDAKELWQGQAAWDVRPMSDFPNWAPDSPTGYVVHDTLSARINPILAIQALAAVLRLKGCDIVTKDTGSTKEEPVVWAKGWQGLLELAEEFQSPVGNGVKGQGALLKFDASNLPQVFAQALHIIPHSNGTLAVGSTSERYFDAPNQCDDLLEDVIARARIVCPAIADAPVLQRWASVRPRAKTRAPMLGPHPKRRGHFIANGGFKIGFGMAPKVGEVMADLILEGRDTIPEDFHVNDNL
jgi:glycine/D-amino acid oxidase-like deaminating enzyme